MAESSYNLRVRKIKPDTLHSLGKSSSRRKKTKTAPDAEQEEHDETDTSRSQAATKRRSPISLLPADVLTMIFELLADEVQGPPRTIRRQSLLPAGRVPQSIFQLRAAHVCTKWRDVVFQTTSFWSRLDVADPDSLNLAKSLIGRLSCRYGLIVDFGCPDVSPFNARLLSDLVPSLVAHGHRLKFLDLRTCPDGTRGFFNALPATFRVSDNFEFSCEPFHDSLRRRCPACNTTETSPTTRPEVGLAKFVGLTHLELNLCSLPSNCPINPYLRIMKLAWVYVARVEDANAFLSSAPNLEELFLLNFTCGGSPDPEPAPFIGTPPMLSRLRVLKLVGSHDGTLPAALFAATFPLLSSLWLDISWGCSVPVPVVADFTLRQASLTELFLFGDEHSGYEDDYSTFPYTIIKRLSATEPSDEVALPRLRSLAISASCYMEDRIYNPRIFAPAYEDRLLTLIEWRDYQTYPLQQLIVAPPPSASFLEEAKARVNVICKPDIELW